MVCVLMMVLMIVVLREDNDCRPQEDGMIACCDLSQQF